MLAGAGEMLLDPEGQEDHEGDAISFHLSVLFMFFMGQKFSLEIPNR
jgi:hypothetical protein